MHVNISRKKMIFFEYQGSSLTQMQSVVKSMLILLLMPRFVLAEQTRATDVCAQFDIIGYVLSASLLFLVSCVCLMSMLHVCVSCMCFMFVYMRFSFSSSRSVHSHMTTISRSRSKWNFCRFQCDFLYTYG